MDPPRHVRVVATRRPGDLTEITNSVVIDRPVPAVFAAWSELERIPEWYVDSIERRKTSEGPAGVGTTYHAVTHADQLAHIGTYALGVRLLRLGDALHVERS